MHHFCHLLTFALLLAVCSPATAQNNSAPAITPQPIPSAIEQALYDSIFQVRKAESDESFKFFSFEVHPLAGYTASSYDGLNTLLTQAAYPAIKNGYFSGGYGASVRIQRVVLGIESVLCDFDKTNQNRRTEMNSSNALIRLGYCWFTPQYNHCFTPHIGLAFGSADITLTDLTAASATNAGNLLTGTAYANVLHYRDRNLALGFGYEHYPSGDARRHNVLGLHADYMVRLGDGRYYPFDYKQRVAGPAINPFLFSLRAVVGFVF